MAIEIAVETPLQDDVRRLVAALNDAIAAQAPDTPGEFVFNLSVEDMTGPAMTVWVARMDGVAVGCGALLRHAGGYGEVKRMYVHPSARGLGVASLILGRIEDQAAGEGLARLALETDSGFDAARRVYERAGYVRCGAFADYPDNPYSVFYEKTLMASPQAAPAL